MTAPRDVARWPRHYRCHFCKPVIVPALIRVLSGIYGGGWPACARHENLAIDAAFAPLRDTKIGVVENYEVTAYRVDIDDQGHPKMGRKLWSARVRKATLHATISGDGT